MDDDELRFTRSEELLRQITQLVTRRVIYLRSHKLTPMQVRLGKQMWEEAGRPHNIGGLLTFPTIMSDTYFRVDYKEWDKEPPPMKGCPHWTNKKQHRCEQMR